MVGIGDDSRAAMPQVWERMESRLSAPLATPTQMPAGRQWRSAWGWGSGSAAVGVPLVARRAGARMDVRPDIKFVKAVENAFK